MILIKDLGMAYATENSTKRNRFGLYQCPNCPKQFRTNMYNVRIGTSTQCRSCATAASNKRRRKR